MADTDPNHHVPDEMATEVFYGFRHYRDTGHFDVEAITGDNVIALPQPGIIDPLDYPFYLTSDATLEFRFSENGHLEMIVL